MIDRVIVERTGAEGSAVFIALLAYFHLKKNSLGRNMVLVTFAAYGFILINLQLGDFNPLPVVGLTILLTLAVVLSMIAGDRRKNRQQGT